MILLLLGGSLGTLPGCRPGSAKAKILYDSAWQEARSGDLRAALKTADSGLASFPSPNSDWHWQFRTLKSEILMRQGLYEDSLSLLDNDLPSNLARSEIAVWQNLTKGASLAYLARYPLAQVALLKARSLAASTQPQLLGEAMLRQGTMASLQWDLKNADTLFKSSLQFARSHNDPFLEASALGSLGLVAARMEHYDESIDWNRQALQLDQSHGWLGLAAKAEGNIGWSYYEVGDLVGALDLFRSADKGDVDAGAPERRVTWLLNAGVVEYDLHNYPAAESAMFQALTLARSLKDPATIIECLQNLTLVVLERNQLDLAQRHLDEVASLESSPPDHPRELYSRIIASYLAQKRGKFSQAERWLLNISRDDQTPTSLRWEALSAIATAHATGGKTILAEREFRESISTISKAEDSIQHEEFRLSFLSNAIRFYHAYIGFLIAQNRPLDALKIADLSRAQTLEHGLSSSTNGTNGKGGQSAASRPQEVARRLNATLLFYWLGEQRSYLWAITPSKVSLLPLPGSAEIAAAVKSYRDSFTGPQDPLEAGNADGKKLYATLIQPVEKLIPKNSRVVVLADGSLNSLNFETLIVPGPKPHYWIEDVTLLTANSLSLLSRTSLSAPPKSANLLLLGDALSASPDFPPLPQAGKEVSLVENYFPESRRSVFTGAQATASRFLSGKPEEFSYLHFATHGTASTTRPLESAVILSREGDSYKLYARDIVQHPIHAYLVTISACNGAGMRTYAGEGLVGLSWAFLRAGAHNVIAGLWEVSNASTPQLMDELYKGLNAGKDPATALRNAKLTLVHSSGNYRRPFYWAPFQLYAGS